MKKKKSVGKVFKAKPYVNKNNKQISITIPKRKIKIFKKKVPKEVKLEIKGIEW